MWDDNLLKEALNGGGGGKLCDEFKRYRLDPKYALMAFTTIIKRKDYLTYGNFPESGTCEMLVNCLKRVLRDLKLRIHRILKTHKPLDFAIYFLSHGTHKNSYEFFLMHQACLYIKESYPALLGVISYSTGTQTYLNPE